MNHDNRLKRKKKKKSQLSITLLLPTAAIDQIHFCKTQALVHSWTDVWVQTTKWKNPGKFMKNTSSCKKTKLYHKWRHSQSRGVLWAPVLLEVLSFLEYTRGRILVDGETNAINIVPNNIYCFRKLLSAIAVSLEKGHWSERTSTFSALNSISRTTNATSNLLHMAWWLQAHTSSSRTTDFLCFIRRVSIYCSHSAAPCPGLEMTHLTALTLIIQQHLNCDLSHHKGRLLLQAHTSSNFRYEGGFDTTQS